MGIVWDILREDGSTAIDNRVYVNGILQPIYERNMKRIMEISNDAIVIHKVLGTAYE